MSKKTILILVEGGVVQAVYTDKGKAEVIIRDYDIEGIDRENLQQGKNGESYSEYRIELNKLKELETAPFEETIEKRVVSGSTRHYITGTNILHRTDGPAVELPDGSKEWWVDGKRHREDGPAVEYADEYKAWWINGRRHREDGPAIEYPNGNKYWFSHGLYHRVDGPAVECIDGHQEWFIHGDKLTEKQFKKRVKKKD